MTKKQWKQMVNDTAKEYNGKNTYTDTLVCNTLWLAESWNLVTLSSRRKREEEIRNIYFQRGWPLKKELYSLGRGCTIGHPFKFEMQEKNFHLSHIHSHFSYFQIWVRWDSYFQSYFVILPPKYYHFFFQ